jgi:gluconolactonase
LEELDMTAWLLLALLAVDPSETTKPITPGGAKLEKVWGEAEFTEGPAYGPGGCVYFSDIGDRIMRYDPATS